MQVEPPWGVEPQTYALRGRGEGATEVHTRTSAQVSRIRDSRGTARHDMN